MIVTPGWKVIGVVALQVFGGRRCVVSDSGELHQQQQAGSHSLFNHQRTVRPRRQVSSDSVSSSSGTFTLPVYTGFSRMRVFSLLPVSENKLSTLQLLCPTMTHKDREHLVAVATAELINWQENNAGEKRHRLCPRDKDNSFWIKRVFLMCVCVVGRCVCHRCVQESGGADVLPGSRHSGAGRGVAGRVSHHDGVEEQQGGLVPLWQVRHSCTHSLCTACMCTSP